MSHRPVQSLSRGLALIRELNVTGPSSVQQLATRTGLNRTTCYRLLETLRQDGAAAVCAGDPKAIENIRSMVRRFGPTAACTCLPNCSRSPC